MAITVAQGLERLHFTASLPDIECTLQTPQALVTISVKGKVVYNEVLWPVDGLLRVCDLCELVAPALDGELRGSLTVTIAERGGADGYTPDQVTLESEVFYCTAQLTFNGDTADASTFLEQHFLTLFQGVRHTTLGRLEYLHYAGTEAAKVRAFYTDGSSKDFSVATRKDDHMYTIDVSPDAFESDGKTLLSYVVSAGNRAQEYVVDFEGADTEPVVVFENSFGVDEVLSCTGLLTTSPSYERSQARIHGRLVNYAIEETRSYKASTGPIDEATAQWADDMLRSKNVRLVEFRSDGPHEGQEVVVTESKSDRTNSDDEIMSMSFTYQLAQRCHNVIVVRKMGRVFDVTFDFTFE